MQLAQRADLVPQLVVAVEGYASRFLPFAAFGAVDAWTRAGGGSW